MAAIEEIGWPAENAGFVNGGVGAVSGTDLGDNPAGLFAVPNECYRHRQASYVANFFPKGVEPGSGVDFFYILACEAAAQGSPVLGSGGSSRSPGTRQRPGAFVEILETPAAQETSVAQGNSLTAPLGVNPDAYADDAPRALGEVGAGASWTAIVDHGSGASAEEVVRDGHDRLDAIHYRSNGEAWVRRIRGRTSTPASASARRRPPTGLRAWPRAARGPAIGTASRPSSTTWCAVRTGRFEAGLDPVRDGAVDAYRFSTSSALAMHHVLLAHAHGMETVRAARADPPAGIVMKLAHLEEVGTGEADRTAVATFDGIQNRWSVQATTEDAHSEDILAAPEPHMTEGWQDNMAAIPAAVAPRYAEVEQDVPPTAWGRGSIQTHCARCRPDLLGSIPATRRSS